MSGRSAKNALRLIGKVTLAHVQDKNSNGAQWVGAISSASNSVKTDFPNVDTIKISGARAHQSHEVPSHSNVISAKFYAGKQRVVSGHIHVNGQIEYGKIRGNFGSDGEPGPSTGKSATNPEPSGSSKWTPTRENVDTETWTIYDPDKGKVRQVAQENGYWYIETKKGRKRF